MENLFGNPWVVGIGVTVIGGLILYFFFGVGKKKNSANTDKSSFISARRNINAGRDIVVGGKIINQKVSKKKLESDLKVDFAEQKISWANYSIGGRIWSSFKMVLSVNNFHNDSPEYIKVYLTANSNDGLWEGRNYIFQNQEDERKSQPNDELRVEPKYKKNVSLFVSNYDVGNSGQNPMPDIDKDTMKLNIETESGKKIVLPVLTGT